MPETIWGAWALAKILGIPITIMSFFAAWKVKLLEVDFDAIPDPYKNVMYFFTTLGSLVFFWERIQKGLHYREQRRKVKIENDHQEWQNKTFEKEHTQSNQKQ